MDILPITIAEPRADWNAAQADTAKDGWFGDLLQARHEPPADRDPEASHAHAPDPDRPAPTDRPEVERPAEDRPAATVPAGDAEANSNGDVAAQPMEPTNQTSSAASIDGTAKAAAAASGPPAAKAPPAKPVPGLRADSAPGTQPTAGQPAEKTTHAGPSPFVPSAAIATADGSGAAPQAAPPFATAPSLQGRFKPKIESRPNGTAAEATAKPVNAREATARKGAATARHATPSSGKAGAEAEAARNAPVLPQGVGGPSGPAAANAAPAAKGAPALQPGMAAASLGPGQSAANGNLPPTAARPATLPPAGGATEQVALRIHKALAGGQDRISIRLHPAELGRIEVKLAWSDDGLMRAMISADKGETLELLQRDQRVLERTLQDAGIKTDSGSLNFDLRGHNGRGEARDDNAPQTADGSAAKDDDERGDTALPPPASRSLHRGLLDLSV